MNNFAEHDHRLTDNFAAELNQRLRSLTSEVAEIRRGTETVFLPRVCGVIRDEKPPAMRDVSVGTQRVRVEDRGVNTDVVEEVPPWLEEEVKSGVREKLNEKIRPDVRKKLKEKVKSEVKDKLKDRVEVKLDVKEDGTSRDKGINTQIMGRIVAGNLLISVSMLSEIRSKCYNTHGFGSDCRP